MKSAVLIHDLCMRGTLAHGRLRVLCFVAFFSCRFTGRPRAAGRCLTPLFMFCPPSLLVSQNFVFFKDGLVAGNPSHERQREAANSRSTSLLQCASWYFNSWHRFRCGPTSGVLCGRIQGTNFHAAQWQQRDGPEGKWRTLVHGRWAPANQSEQLMCSTAGVPLSSLQHANPRALPRRKWLQRFLGVLVEFGSGVF